MIAGWITIQLDEACILITDGTHHSPPNGPVGDFIYITAKNIRPHGIDLTNVTFVSEAVHTEIISRCNPEYGDVLYIKDGVTTGIAVVNTLRESFAMLSSVALLKPQAELINPSYLKHWLNSPSTFSAMTGQMAGSAIKRLVLKQIRRSSIVVPPINEQRRISSKIDACMERSGRAKTALDAIPALLDRYRQSVLAAAFRGDLTADWRAQNPDVEPASKLRERINDRRQCLWEADEILRSKARNRELKGSRWKENYQTPKLGTDIFGKNIPNSWECVTLDALLSKIEAGKNFKCIERPPMAGEVGLVKISSVTWGKFDQEESKTAPPNTHIPVYNKIGLGDFLFSRANTIDLVGACVIVDSISKDLFLSDKVLRFRFALDLEHYVMWFLRSPIGRFQIQNLSSGNQQSMRNIGQNKIKEINVPLPPEPEIRLIERLISQHMSTSLELRRARDSASDQVSSLNQSVLAKAFRGELVPQDPNDEPASVLLDRIRAERAAQSSKPRRRGRPPASAKSA